MTAVRMFKNLAGAFREWRERERAYAELSALDDRTLADLGLRRADLPFVVFGDTRRQRMVANSNSSGQEAA